MDELADEMRETKQRLAGLEQDARQPHLAMEGDVPSDTKTRDRTEGTAAAVQAKHGDSCSAKIVQAGPTSSASFVMKVELSALPRRDDVSVDMGAAVPKPCLSPVEMRTLTAPGGLLPTGKTSTATITIFHQLPLWLCLTKNIKYRTSRHATDGFRKLKILETKSSQTLVFDPGGFTGHLRTCPFLGAWRTLLCGVVLRLGTGWYPRLQRVLADG